jgi:hypothetical protein
VEGLALGALSVSDGSRRGKLDSQATPVDNQNMQTQGIVQNGAIIVEGGVSFPEGTSVIVSAIANHPAPTEKKRIELPLVHCDKPGSIDLTSEMVGELLYAEDVSPQH